MICAALRADSPNDLVTKGDAFDVRLEAAEALQFYLPAEKLQPTNVSLAGAFARQYRHLMANATTGDEKLRLGGIALDYAQRAAALAPETPRRSSPLRLNLRGVSERRGLYPASLNATRRKRHGHARVVCFPSSNVTISLQKLSGKRERRSLVDEVIQLMKQLD